MPYKLTEKEVREIYALFKKGDLTTTETAKMYGISSEAVRSIKSGRVWQHLELEPLDGIHRRKKSVKRRILEASKLNLISGCWEWQQSCSSRGYGKIGILGKSKHAHRSAYEEFIGPIPEGMYVCHKCDNPSCCNPEHLFLGTAKDNSMDRDSKGRQSRGSRHTSSKLSEETVIEIIKMLNDGERPFNIAKAFNVTQSIVCHIKVGRTWRHVTGVQPPVTQHPGA